MEKSKVQIEEQERIGMEVASLNRLINGHHEFFNFINIHDGWNRWVSGRYTLNTIDSMGETLCRAIDKFWKKNHLDLSKTNSSGRLLVLDYKGAYFLLRKLDGKEEFAAINMIEGIYNIRILSWEKLHQFLQNELVLMNELVRDMENKSLVVPINIYSKPV